MTFKIFLSIPHSTLHSKNINSNLETKGIESQTNRLSSYSTERLNDFNRWEPLEKKFYLSISTVTENKEKVSYLFTGTAEVNNKLETERDIQRMPCRYPGLS